MSLAIKQARTRGGMPGRVQMGDPGLFGWLGKQVKKIAKPFVSSIPIVGPGLAAILGPSSVPPSQEFVGPDGCRWEGGTPFYRNQAGTCAPGRGPMMSTMPVSPPPAPGRSGGLVDYSRRAIKPLADRIFGTEAVAMNGANGAPKGYVLNKSSYFLMDGSFVPKGSKWVKIRRRNPANARALSRAIGRIDLGKKLQGTLHEIETKKYTKAGNRKACPAK